MTDSLRLRLIGAILAAVLAGLGAAGLMAGCETRAAAALPRLMEEPYQDFLILVPLGLLSIALAWIVSGRSLRAVEGASRAAAALGPGDREARIALAGLPREVRPLVEAFNGALDRLSAAHGNERRFVSDAAHEIRTPLALLSLRLQKARADGRVDWDAIDREVAGLQRLATQLLDLARKDHSARVGDRSEFRAVDLARIAREAAAAAIPAAEAEGREIRVDMPRHLPVAGDAADLADLVRNLLDNALRHGRGRVRVAGRAAWAEDRDLAVLTVEDEGPGVPPGCEATVFDRFSKADRASPGHGLGLAIVRETVRFHGGTVRMAGGAGARIEVRLPAAEASGIAAAGTAASGALARRAAAPAGSGR